MLFQALDAKDHCVGIYADNKIVYDEIPSSLSKTWSFASFLKNKEIEYASLYVQNKSLDKVCPEHLKESWLAVSNKLKAFFRSFLQAKISLEELCFFDLVPQNFLLDYFYVKSEITQYVFNNFPKPSNYDFLAELSKVVMDIQSQKLNIQKTNLGISAKKPQCRAAFKTAFKAKPYIQYNIFGTKTGRLTTKPNSFPILTLPRECRYIIHPQNDFFVELDFNAAELRTFIALQGLSQPIDDIHAWLMQNALNGVSDRTMAKKQIFAWLYNPSAFHKKLDQIFDKENLIKKFWDGKTVSTPFKRQIPSDKKHALNYLIQSSTSDLFLRQMIKVYDYMKGLKSHVAFCVHDSLVLDMAIQDKEKLEGIKNIFSSTDMGVFRVNSSSGTTYGKMKIMK